MVDRNILISKKRNRYMVLGEVGSGKTTTLVKLTKQYVNKQQKVLFIDYKDIGATELLMNLTDDELKYIQYETPTNYTQLQNIDVLNDHKLIVIDAFHHLRFDCRKFIRDEYISQGYYTVNCKPVKINNLNTFSLSHIGYGGGYSEAKLRENYIIDKYINCGKDVAISIIPEDTSGKSIFADSLMANFDNIIEVSYTDDNTTGRTWNYRIRRWRGIQDNNYNEQVVNEELDPFTEIHSANNKIKIDYTVTYLLNSKNNKKIISAFDKKQAEETLLKLYPQAKNIKVF